MAAAFGVGRLGDAGAGGPQLGDEPLPVERDGDRPADGVDVRGAGNEHRVVHDRADLRAVEQDPRDDPAGLGLGRVAACVDVAVVDPEDEPRVGIPECLGDRPAHRLRVAVAAGEPEPEILQRGGPGEAAPQHPDREGEGDQPDRDHLGGGDVDRSSPSNGGSTFAAKTM